VLPVGLLLLMLLGQVGLAHVDDTQRLECLLGVVQRPLSKHAVADGNISELNGLCISHGLAGGYAQKLGRGRHGNLVSLARVRFNGERGRILIGRGHHADDPVAWRGGGRLRGSGQPHGRRERA